MDFKVFSINGRLRQPIISWAVLAQLMIEPVYSITSAMRSWFSNISTTENRAIETVDRWFWLWCELVKPGISAWILNLRIIQYSWGEYIKNVFELQKNDVLQFGSSNCNNAFYFLTHVGVGEEI